MQKRKKVTETKENKMQNDKLEGHFFNCDQWISQKPQRAVIKKMLQKKAIESGLSKQERKKFALDANFYKYRLCNVILLHNA